MCVEVEYTGPETLLEYTVGQMMLKNMGNNTDSDYAGMKVGLGGPWQLSTIVMPGLVQVSLLLTRRWFYHAVSVFLQSVLLLVVAYTTFYYRVDNFQVIRG